ncbi:electron transport complex subunit RsxG [Buchnera aphidicola (Melanaphis sacchari)]|uniref:Ion-translocating oxidoreductase complex subunit G n=1 Tax=Buchnera aphidicola (Melanaphis sacchari) TaxID=2173854 RepID=A0A2U8DFS2_9GAMM|nr:electron transport complex subunit RsxG [Buchnera aphidicola]AWH90648.1 electron transport complex subunit RsxG [Buchnera aphidicola (Melanaphis sacchari)]
MKFFKEILINSFLISIFSSIFLSIVVYVNYLTKEKILYQQEKEKKVFLEQVLPLNMRNHIRKNSYLVQDNLLGDKNNHNVWLLLNNNHKEEGAIVESIAPDGYSGSIHILVAAYFNGKIIGVRVLSHKETPGIGDNIEISRSNWITKFNNMRVKNLNDHHFLVEKYGGKIEQFTGATITPQSVSNAVKRTVIFIKKIPLLFSL